VGSYIFIACSKATSKKINKEVRKMLRNAKSLASLMGLAALILLGFSFVAARSVNAQPIRIIQAFQTMYGVDGPFVGDDNPIRDVNGDISPWEVEKFIHGSLDTEGNLIILVRGLVIKDEVPGVGGTNPDKHFRGLVSCLTEESEEDVGMENVVTKDFPADAQGNSFIHQKLELPNPCVAPIIFVIGSTDTENNPKFGRVWFAVTGFEQEED
jgi:hypothetical protein